MLSNDIDPALLEIVKTTNPKPVPPTSALVFGRNFTDHMLKISWSASEGWGAPRIEPFGPVALDPSCSVLQYATTLFEGMKAYRDKNGKVTMFRPDMNMKRMNRSASRIALPTFNGDALLELIKKLIQLDKHWVPDDPGTSLYIRPNLIGSNAGLGVAPPTEALLWVICCPVGPYYASGFKPIPLHATADYIRAFPNGTGSYKLGLNYAPCFVPQREAAAKGSIQNLWLHGPEHYLTEVGTMNLFVVFKDANDALEVVTAPLDGLILPGVTRDSVITLLRAHIAGEVKLAGLSTNLAIHERAVTMKEVLQAKEKGCLIEMFGAGTAVVISPVSTVDYLDEKINIPTGTDGLGPVAGVMLRELSGRQTGVIPSNWNYIVCEN